MACLPFHILNQGSSQHGGLMIIYEWGDVVRKWGVQHVSEELDTMMQ